MSRPGSLRRGALRSFLLYGLDMGFALIGWIYGFGMTVHNWWALIGSMFVARWVFHVLSHAFYLRDAKAAAEVDSEGSAP